ncbi:hypothetical protein DACRYDRAFT_103346 [Dacryopinax primogenitus]|uniref:Uncharacterized protein n=1 Tax=Dacryopinax primogenitus (strain DJM 731) TaxID=1858805 RepID=M5G860_DACPD|nr:uncharacterized protein DACRYDRAFT_103346 [Dacryopinax primogenitus]EJU06401.1 hypothetical protein DACRYDRAFT_103346 [Dacryopinax primogenitus]
MARNKTRVIYRGPPKRPRGMWNDHPIPPYPDPFSNGTTDRRPSSPISQEPLRDRNSFSAGYSSTSNSRPGDNWETDKNWNAPLSGVEGQVREQEQGRGQGRYNSPPPSVWQTYKPIELPEEIRYVGPSSTYRPPSPVQRNEPQPRPPSNAPPGGPRNGYTAPAPFRHPPPTEPRALRIAREKERQKEAERQEDLWAREREKEKERDLYAPGERQEYERQRESPRDCPPLSAPSGPRKNPGSIFLISPATASALGNHERSRPACSPFPNSFSPSGASSAARGLPPRVGAFSIFSPVRSSTVPSNNSRELRTSFHAGPNPSNSHPGPNRTSPIPNTTTIITHPIPSVAAPASTVRASGDPPKAEGWTREFIPNQRARLQEYAAADAAKEREREMDRENSQARAQAQVRAEISQHVDSEGISANTSTGTTRDQVWVPTTSPRRNSANSVMLREPSVLSISQRAGSVASTASGCGKALGTPPVPPAAVAWGHGTAGGALKQDSRAGYQTPSGTSGRPQPEHGLEIKRGETPRTAVRDFVPRQVVKMRRSGQDASANSLQESSTVEDIPGFGTFRSVKGIPSTSPDKVVEEHIVKHETSFGSSGQSTVASLFHRLSEVPISESSPVGTAPTSTSLPPGLGALATVVSLAQNIGRSPSPLIQALMDEMLPKPRQKNDAAPATPSPLRSTDASSDPKCASSPDASAEDSASGEPSAAVVQRKSSKSGVNRRVKSATSSPRSKSTVPSVIPGCSSAAGSVSVSSSLEPIPGLGGISAFGELASMPDEAIPGLGINKSSITPPLSSTSISRHTSAIIPSRGSASTLDHPKIDRTINSRNFDSESSRNTPRSSSNQPEVYSPTLSDSLYPISPSLVQGTGTPNATVLVPTVTDAILPSTIRSPSTISEDLLSFFAPLPPGLGSLPPPLSAITSTNEGETLEPPTTSSMDTSPTSENNSTLSMLQDLVIPSKETEDHGQQEPEKALPQSHDPPPDKQESARVMSPVFPASHLSSIVATEPDSSSPLTLVQSTSPVESLVVLPGGQSLDEMDMQMTKDFLGGSHSVAEQHSPKDVSEMSPKVVVENAMEAAATDAAIDPISRILESHNYAAPSTASKASDPEISCVDYMEDVGDSMPSPPFLPRTYCPEPSSDDPWTVADGTLEFPTTLGPPNALFSPLETAGDFSDPRIGTPTPFETLSVISNAVILDDGEVQATPALDEEDRVISSRTEPPLSSPSSSPLLSPPPAQRLQDYANFVKSNKQRKQALLVELAVTTDPIERYPIKMKLNELQMVDDMIPDLGTTLAWRPEAWHDPIVGVTVAQAPTSEGSSTPVAVVKWVPPPEPTELAFDQPFSNLMTRNEMMMPNRKQMGTSRRFVLHGVPVKSLNAVREYAETYGYVKIFYPLAHEDVLLVFRKTPPAFEKLGNLHIPSLGTIRFTEGCSVA